MHIYLTITKEFVFRRRNPFLPGPPAVLVGSHRVEEFIKFTGVYVQSNVNVDSQLNFDLSQCSFGRSSDKAFGHSS